MSLATCLCPTQANLAEFIKDEYLERSTSVDASDWATHEPSGIPHQLNCSDCGVFMVTFAEFEVRALSCESQPDSPTLRCTVRVLRFVPRKGVRRPGE